jgi:uncharacterized protein (TIGR03546 family)
MNKEKLKKRFKEILSLDSHPAHIAAGFAVGVFISITPFFGLHTPLAIAAAFIFRLNKLTTIAGAWVNTPLTVVPVLAGSYKLGRFLRGKEIKPFVIKSLQWADMKVYAKSLLLGSSIIGLVAAVIAYFLIYWLVVRFRRKDPGLAELTRESVLTGEDLELDQKQ